MSRKKNILVTGADGFVGRALIKKLPKIQNNIFPVSRGDGDLADKKFCRKIVKDTDTVYYLAGFRKNVAVHTREPFTALSGNVLPLISFLEEVKKSKVKTIIYTSSTHVEYGLVGDNMDGYVLGKYMNELILKSFAKETGIDVKIVRYAAIYGPGNSFDPKISNIIPSLIVKAAEAKDKMTIWGKGVRKMQFIYIDDVVRTLIKVSKSNGNFFIVGNRETISVIDLVKKILKLMKKNLKIERDLSKPDKATKLSTFDAHLKARVNLDKGLKETIMDYKKSYA